MVLLGWYRVFEIGTVGPPEKRSEVLVAWPQKRNQYRWRSSADFLAKMLRGARKKFRLQSWRQKVQECCLQSWCLLCMQTTSVEEKCNVKCSSWCKDFGYSIVFVHVFVFSVFVEGIRYIDVQNLQRGVLETCVTASLPEPSDVQSKLQHALATLYPHHSPSHTIEPRMLQVSLDKVVPKTNTIHAKDTRLATLMHKKFAEPPLNTIPVLTTREGVGKTTPSNHEIS